MSGERIKKHGSGVLLMTEGNPVSLILLFSVPMLIGNLFQQVYNLVDSVIVGRYVGADALAAIGATTSVTFLFSRCATVSERAEASSLPSISEGRTMLRSGAVS